MKRTLIKMTHSLFTETRLHHPYHVKLNLFIICHQVVGATLPARPFWGEDEVRAEFYAREYSAKSLSTGFLSCTFSMLIKG